MKKFTATQVMTTMYPKGISTDDMTTALELHERLILAATGAEEVDSTDAQIVDETPVQRTKAIRKVPTTANLIRKIHKKVKANRDAKELRESFLAELRKGGTLQEISKTVGVSKTYGYPILNALKDEGARVSKTPVPGQPRTLVYKLES